MSSRPSKDGGPPDKRHRSGGDGGQHTRPPSSEENLSGDDLSGETRFFIFPSPPSILPSSHLTTAPPLPPASQILLPSIVPRARRAAKTSRKAASGLAFPGPRGPRARAAAAAIRGAIRRGRGTAAAAVATAAASAGHTPATTPSLRWARGAPSLRAVVEGTAAGAAGRRAAQLARGAPPTASSPARPRPGPRPRPPPRTTTRSARGWRSAWESWRARCCA